jgi:hypothetical protein
MRLISTLAILSGLIMVGSVQAQNPLGIGQKAPAADQVVEDINGRTLNFNEAVQRNGLLIIFLSNTCPWVAKWESRVNSLYNQASVNNIGMIALNPNERIRDRGESMEDMRKRSKKMNYNFYYALDKDHKIADALGASRTPEVFLFDGNLNLVYHGAIDDNADNVGSVSEAYASDAIDFLLSNGEVLNQQSKLQGCPIKRTE